MTPSPTLPAVLRVAESQPTYHPAYCLLCGFPLERGPRQHNRKRHPICAKAAEGVYQAEWRREHPEYQRKRKAGY